MVYRVSFFHCMGSGPRFSVFSRVLSKCQTTTLFSDGDGANRA